MKIIFAKNHEEALRQLQLNFYPVPAKSAGTYLFRDHSAETPQIRMHIDSYTHSVLVFFKIGPGQLSINGMVVASQNHPILAFRK